MWQWNCPALRQDDGVVRSHLTVDCDLVISLGCSWLGSQQYKLCLPCILSFRSSTRFFLLLPRDSSSLLRCVYSFSLHLPLFLDASYKYSFNHGGYSLSTHHSLLRTMILRLSTQLALRVASRQCFVYMYVDCPPLLFPFSLPFLSSPSIPLSLSTFTLPSTLPCLLRCPSLYSRTSDTSPATRTCVSRVLASLLDAHHGHVLHIAPNHIPSSMDNPHHVADCLEEVSSNCLSDLTHSNEDSTFFQIAYQEPPSHLYLSLNLKSISDHDSQRPKVSLVRFD